MGKWLIRFIILFVIASVVVGCLRGTFGKTVVAGLIVAGISTVVWPLVFLWLFGLWNKPREPEPGQKYVGDMDSWCKCAGMCTVMGDLAMFVFATGAIASIRFISFLL